MVFAMRKAIHRFSVSVNCGPAGGSGKNYRDDGFLILRESYSESEGPRISAKRAFPATLTPGATFRIPFFVDKYAANKAHWLRFKAQNGSGAWILPDGMAGTITRKMDNRAQLHGHIFGHDYADSV